MRLRPGDSRRMGEYIERQCLARTGMRTPLGCLLEMELGGPSPCYLQLLECTGSHGGNQVPGDAEAVGLRLRRRSGSRVPWEQVGYSTKGQEKGMSWFGPGMGGSVPTAFLWAASGAKTSGVQGSTVYSHLPRNGPARSCLCPTLRKASRENPAIWSQTGQGERILPKTEVSRVRPFSVMS